MNKSCARAWIFVAMLAAAPVVALDFHHWRTDGIIIQGSSLRQQSSNQGNNIHEDLLDPSSSSWGLYWVGEKQENGGLVAGTPFGATPPSTALKDNREQDPEVDWDTWSARTGKTLGGVYGSAQPARPVFTPNVPQAWGPVEADLGGGNIFGANTADHLLVGVSFTPPKVGDANGQNREQILTAYYPQMAAGLPGNNNNAGTPVAAADQFTVRPLWARPYMSVGGDADPQLPGIRISDLDGKNDHLVTTDYNNAGKPNMGVVTQPPIFARVPATYTVGGKTVTEVLPVVYLVVGTGEDNETVSGANGDFATVYCIALRRPGGLDPSNNKSDTKGNWLPNTATQTVHDPIHAPNPWLFNPAQAPEQQGCIMWSYEVHGRAAANVATPVAGVSFANVGDEKDSRPLLFLTTADGQIIALNAKALDSSAAGVDDDPVAGAPRWTWKTPTVPFMGGIEPGFLYGMAPAVARVSLNNLFSSTGSAKNTVANAVKNYKVSEWMLFVADNYGDLWALDAPGHRDPNVGSHWTQNAGDERWRLDPGANPRLDVHGNPERFIVPPLVYQGNTPLQDRGGTTVNGSADVGYDDEVIFASEKGSVYALDAIGQLTVGAGTDGKPNGLTAVRWQYPTDDTSFQPNVAWDPETATYPNASNTGTADPLTAEPRVWPRKLRDMGTVFRGKKIDIANTVADYDSYFCRAPLAVGLGGNANPDGAQPNLDVGEHAIYVPYMQEDTSSFALHRAFYEYVGSLKPYGFIEMSQPIAELDTTAAKAPTATIGGKLRKIPIRLLSVGTVKYNGVPVNLVPTTPAGINGGTNAFYDPTYQNPGDTVYFSSPTWYDEDNSEWVTLPFGTDVTISYFPPTSPSNFAPAGTSITETLRYPSCYRQEFTNAADLSQTAIVRGQATLDEANTRLELRRRTPGVTPATNQDEKPAEVLTALWGDPPAAAGGPPPNPALGGYRPGAMLASGGAGSGGVVMVPALFRGRIIAFNDHLQALRVVHGSFDPRMDPVVSGAPGNFGDPVKNAGGHYGPSLTDDQYDPGEFYIDPSATTPNPNPPYLVEEPLLTRVGASVTIVDGWMYVVYRNGHMRAYANVGGGAGGTSGGNPPMFQPPNAISPNAGTVVKSPGLMLNGGGIHVAFDNPVTPGAGGNAPTNPSIDTTKYVDTDPDHPYRPLMLEWGQTIYMVVDFGAGALDVDVDPRFAGDTIDQRVLQNEIQAQIRSSNGAVQQLPGVNKGARVQRYSVGGVDHFAAVIPLFCGIPSATNPLTPGTPLLFERDPNAAQANRTFVNELTYDVQVTQQGMQWYWGAPDPDQNNPKPIDPKKTHFWEVEPNQGAKRFPTTGGPNNWTFHPGGGLLNTNEWAPLVSYNNPFVMRYKPDGPGGVLHGIPRGSTFQPNDAVGLIETYDDPLDPGRKNGDVYAVPYVPGSHSGAGQPVVPTVGQALVNGNAKQILFADHGKTTLATSTAYPDLAKLYVADRSHMGLIGRNVAVRVQTAPLTKLGVGAVLGFNGTSPNPNTAPAGSFEQNLKTWDDGPDQIYPSIPQSRVIVTKAGSSVDLRQGSAAIPGRVPGRNTRGFFEAPPAANPNQQLTTQQEQLLIAQMDALAVQVDVPLYTADDVYGTRWRATDATGKGANPNQPVNPFFPNTLFNSFAASLQPQSMWDRAEELSQPNQQVGPTPLGDQGASPNDLKNPGQSDRTRRIVVFNDANGNGQLDLLPNYREAYRTFEVQVAVKPDMKLQAAQQTIDLGAVWQGKKQPGLGQGAADIREWQWMQANLSQNNTPGQIARFYQQYWRPFNIQNTGNVNLAYVKPELIFQQANNIGFLALASAGNDPWKSLSLINPNPNQAAALVDPTQLFLRTSFDDQLLPDTQTFYGGGTRGAWLQKAAMGAGQPGSVLYAEGSGINNTPSGNAVNRDPSNGGTPRPTWLALNIPTGSVLGQFSGTLRFYNDRAVSLVENPNNDQAAPAGYQYATPQGETAENGALERDVQSSDPLEPVTEPPFNIKVKVTENMVHGRYQVASGTQDLPDRRVMPTATAEADNTGQVLSLMLAYASDRDNQPANYNLLGTRLPFNTNTNLFPFDELPLDRAPWMNLAGNAPGFDIFTNVASLGLGSQISKPALRQFAPQEQVMTWIERKTVGAGNNEYRILYRTASSSTVIPLAPGGQMDVRSAKSGVQMTPVTTALGKRFLAFYSANQGTRRNLEYTWIDAANLNNGNAWAPETTLPTSPSLSSVNDPHVFILDQTTRAAALGAAPGQPAFTLPDNTVLPQMACVTYSGTSQRAGRTDIYMDRIRMNALTPPQSGRGVVNQLGADYEYGKVAFPHLENELLQANANRSIYSANGIDWLLRTWDALPVQVFLYRPEQPNKAYPLLETGANSTLLNLVRTSPNTLNQEFALPLNPATIAAAPAGNQNALKSVRVLIDRAAGTVRFSTDTRTLARLLSTFGMAANSPDPVVTASYTPATLRLTRGDISANDPVVVPVVSKPGTQIMDASWYQQQIDGSKWLNGQPVAAQADRLWLFWRRSGGAVSGGSTCYYKVLRPGFRVNAGAIFDVQTLSTSAGRPAEVNPQTGTVFFPYSYEGQQITITYKIPDPSNPNQLITVQNEPHVVTWVDESGERPVPMETAVNEGSLDGFATYEQAYMSDFGSTTWKAVPHMEKIWLFWSSTRGTGGDVFYATLAPRLGPDVNVGQLQRGTGVVVLGSGLTASRVQQLNQQAADDARWHPFVLPPMARRGPLSTAAAPARTSATR